MIYSKLQCRVIKLLIAIVDNYLYQ